MTREQWIEEIFKTYHLVSVLSDRNDCKTLRIRHKELGKDLVLRTFPNRIPAYDELLSIRSPYLPEVFESLTLEDGHGTLEEYVNGITLAEMMEIRRYSYKEARSVLLGLCNALTVLHERKIIHRDIKPENILTDGNGRIVLIDLNISRIENGNKRDTVVMGTVGYASPEQLGVAQSDARTDIYAAGVLLNVLLTGKHPSETLAPGRAGRIVRKCTDVNPRTRFQSAKQLAEAL